MEMLVAPTVVENVPYEHGIHARLALTSLYVPGIHAIHTLSPIAHVYPTLHVQLTALWLPGTCENELSGHALHDDFEVARLSEEYFPCEHNMHSP